MTFARISETDVVLFLALYSLLLIHLSSNTRFLELEISWKRVTNVVQVGKFYVEICKVVILSKFHWKYHWLFLQQIAHFAVRSMYLTRQKNETDSICDTISSSGLLASFNSGISECLDYKLTL